MSLAYYKRILQAYLGKGASQLSFWHGAPQINESAFNRGSQEYYQGFLRKAQYEGPFDDGGIPLLDYRGEIGPQYNPIAIAQFGLGCWNMFCRSGVAEWERKAIAVADWLVDNLDSNPHGLRVWMHHFDWEYFRTLKAPWYSGLAQGQGLSLLTRVQQHTGEERYRAAAEQAFASLLTPVEKGGALFVDDDGYWWIEEYITDPPTHILNGMMWALWGVYDYMDFQVRRNGSKAAAEAERARELWEHGLETLEGNLSRFDCGYWSLYDKAPVRLKNPASPFYHALHIVQLEVMTRLSGRDGLRTWAQHWRTYQSRFLNRKRAYGAKILFKLTCY